MDFGSSLTIKARTITIFSGHMVLSSQHTHMDAALGFFLEVFDRHEEDSPGMNRGKMDPTTIALAAYNSNSID